MTEPIAWLPVICYAAAAALDFVDGALARYVERVTALGAALDAEFDALAILVGSVVAVAGGLLPAWYVAVGLAKYAYLGGLRLRRSLGLPIYDLPDRPSRRALAGLQMAFIAAALAPLPLGSGQFVGAALFGGGYLLGFARDWLYVSGVLRA